jgi:dephospho-CoA kinase
MKTGITGGIGSGKSYVCTLLKQRGIRVYDCDTEAKRLMNSSDEIYRQLCRLIGPEVYQTDSDALATGRHARTLNKAVMQQFLLASDRNTQAVNDIVHPVVARDFQESGFDWMECAILYESGFERLVDKVIAVTAPIETRIERIMQRNGISREQAMEWIAKQWPQEEIARRADFIIDNDGEKDLLPQIEEILKTKH